ncbi:MAG: DTW domain-containing protein [Bdellovibrionales bacterium]|nr:DTW domain-containing protein [Bdellovibrionales bacterium]
MDKATYLKLKEERLQAALVLKHPKETFCYGCHRLQKNCLCDIITPFETKIRFVILMHPMEAKKEKMGTGRISLAMLKNSAMIMGVDFTEDPEVNALISDPNNFCMTMYPGEKSVNVSEHDVTPIQNLFTQKKNVIVFLIDGTWPCAKKMMRLSKNIKALPRVSFTATHTSMFEIKEQPADYCLSTLESIHFFIHECNRRGLEETNKAHDQMLVVFKAMIDFQMKCALDPSLSSYKRGSKLGYSKKEDRVKAKKWLTKSRSVILPDR